MQKSRILLLMFLFPMVVFLLINLLIKSYAQNNQLKNLPTKIAFAASPTKTPAYFPSKTPIPQIPSPTITIKSAVFQKTKKETIMQENSSPTDFILQKVNEYRLSLGLQSVTSNSETCEFAKIRAEEISSAEKFNHDGFSKRVSEHTLPYPNYSEVTENIAYNTDYKDVVSRWIASPGHAENMRKNTSYVCIASFGDYYTYEGWQP